MTRRLPLHVLLILAALIPAAQILGIAVAQAQQAIISVTDPSGDDKGPGYYGYPTNPVFAEGVFDIVKFEVYTTDTSVVFKVYYRNLGGNPWNGPNGFCLQYTHIYVRTTQVDAPARTDTIGLSVFLRPDYAWHFALLLAPGWEEKPVPEGQRAALVYANGTVAVQDGGFKVYADTANNAVVAEVSKDLIPDVDNAAKWKIVVFAASYDGFGPYRVRPVSIDKGEWVVWGAADPAYKAKVAKAVTLGLAPRVLDLAIYSPDEYPKGISADDQYKVLDSYNPDKGMPAVVPALLPTTVTVTQTVVQTQTLMQTVTLTQTQTVISTTTSISTTTVPTPDYTAAAIIGVVLLIVGFAVGYLVKRPAKK